MAEKTGVRLFSMEAAAKHFGLDMIKWEDCARWVVAQLHPDGPACPKCSAPLAEDQRDTFSLMEQVRCSSCSTKFTAKTGTVISNSKLELREIYLIAVLSHLGVPAQAIAGQLGVHVDTVTTWQSHFRAQQELAGA